MSTTFSLMRVLMADTAASTGPLPVAMAMRSWSPNFQHHGRRRFRRSGGHLQEFERYGLLFHAVDVAHQIQQVVIVDLLLPVGQFEELGVGVVRLLLALRL